MRRCFVIAATAVLMSSPAAAQVGELQPGARVRISAPGLVADDYVGVLLQRVGDTLVVAGTNLAQVRLPIAQIAGLEISRGKSRADGAIEGVKWGAPIMGVLGLVLFNAGSEVSCTGTCTVNEYDRFSIGALFAVSGAIYGAGIGALIGKERWEEFDVGARTALRVQRGRVGVGLAYTF